MRRPNGLRMSVYAQKADRPMLGEIGAESQGATALGLPADLSTALALTLLELPDLGSFRVLVRRTASRTSG